MNTTKQNVEVKDLLLPGHKHLKSLKHCREGVGKWNEIRWDVTAAIHRLNKGWVFRLTKDVLNHIDTKTKDATARGYLALFDNKLHLVLLDTALDVAIYNGAVTKANLYTAPYVKLGVEVSTLLKGSGHLYEKMRRWVDCYKEYTTKVIESHIHIKSDENGFVRLFEIKVSDIVNEFKHNSRYVYTFIGIKPEDIEKSIDLIFMGITADKITSPRLHDAPDDFTTPRPPFGQDYDYGLL